MSHIQNVRVTEIEPDKFSIKIASKNGLPKSSSTSFFSSLFSRKTEAAKAAEEAAVKAEAEAAEEAAVKAEAVKAAAIKAAAKSPSWYTRGANEEGKRIKSERNLQNEQYSEFIQREESALLSEATKRRAAENALNGTPTALRNKDKTTIASLRQERPRLSKKNFILQTKTKYENISRSKGSNSLLRGRISNLLKAILTPDQIDKNKKPIPAEIQLSNQKRAVIDLLTFRKQKEKELEEADKALGKAEEAATPKGINAELETLYNNVKRAKVSAREAEKDHYIAIHNLLKLGNPGIDIVDIMDVSTRGKIYAFAKAQRSPQLDAFMKTRERMDHLKKAAAELKVRYNRMMGELTTKNGRYKIEESLKRVVEAKLEAYNILVNTVEIAEEAVKQANVFADEQSTDPEIKETIDETLKREADNEAKHIEMEREQANIRAAALNDKVTGPTGLRIKKEISNAEREEAKAQLKKRGVNNATNTEINKYLTLSKYELNKRKAAVTTSLEMNDYVIESNMATAANIIKAERAAPASVPVVLTSSTAAASVPVPVVASVPPASGSAASAAAASVPAPVVLTSSTAAAASKGGRRRSHKRVHQSRKRSYKRSHTRVHRSRRAYRRTRR